MLRYLVLVLLFVIFPTCTARRISNIPLPRGAVGPETLAFDCQGRGPYVGVSDGRILKYIGLGRWSEYATMPTWSRSCIGINNSPYERSCGRPLGLKFHPKTCVLYVADAYHGLVEVAPGGGQGYTVAKAADGVPFKFMNSLDINPESGVIYFTDSSTRFERWEFQSILDTRDCTGRVMVYNPVDRTVQVLLNNLPFPNGVALGSHNEFLLISETTTGQIYKHWLRGPRAHQSDLLITLEGHPDNINRDYAGNFWIAQVQTLPSRPGSGDGGFSIKINPIGQIIERLDGRPGKPVMDASDVKQVAGRVWIGNVVNPFVEVSY